MRPPLAGLDGAEEIRDAVNAWWQEPDAPTLRVRELAQSKRRSVFHIQPTGKTGLIVKCFREKSGRATLLSLTKRALGRAPWQREKRGLEALRADPPLAPAFFGLARTPHGEMLVISEFIPGPSLWKTLNSAE
ncbi:MAG: hypothetical protein VX252_07945, partial [Myxococcota bacterium]|nr:hypothetical protein [Myxococcota bacterium]